MGYEGCSIFFFNKKKQTKQKKKKEEVDQEWLKLSSTKLSWVRFRDSEQTISPKNIEIYYLGYIYRVLKIIKLLYGKTSIQVITPLIIVK